MKIKLHGGDCCGVKHIHGLGGYPHDLKLSARKASKMTSFGQKGPYVSLSDGHNDMMSKNPKKNCDFFNEAAPEETYTERFIRFVSFIKKHRPHGIIEVILTTFQKGWIPILEEQGFKAVSTGKNSNTGGTITIYHLVY